MRFKLEVKILVQYFNIINNLFIYIEYLPVSPCNPSVFVDNLTHNAFLKNLQLTVSTLLQALYNSLILSRINYGILLWGYQSERIFKLQKKALRIISLKKYNAHTEPIFKSLNLLKLSDIFSLCQLKFYHNLVHREVY